MKIVVAPDSYKECLPAGKVAAAMARAARSRWPEAEVIQLPLADGGEGTLDILSTALHATGYTAQVHDPLGRPIPARFAITTEVHEQLRLCGVPLGPTRDPGHSEPTAIIEVAQAVGLSLLTKAERNPLKANSRGVGELILAAYERGARHFIVGLGGSATCDGGAGMIDLLGTDPRKRLPGCTLELLCDVDAPYIGPRGAARVFAPQKGAGPAEVELLEQKMVQMAAKLNTAFGVDVAEVPGAGAAGGLAGALMATLGARIVPGISRILDLVRFQEAIRDADLIFTGEGKSDSQTLMGKVPYGVLQKACGIPVALVSGRIEDVEALSQAGFGPIVEVSPRNLPLLQVLDPVVATDNIPKAIYNVHF